MKMSSDRQDADDRETDARMLIQDIIDQLRVDEINLTEPGNLRLDGQIEMLDKIFTEYAGDGEDNENTPGGMGKSVDVSQARLDIVAFSKLAAINHQRIRRVAASSWTFRATDFAHRIVGMMNIEEGSQSESLTDGTKIKLDELTNSYFNQCVPLKPFLGAIVLTKVEAAAKERRARAPRVVQEKVVAQKLQARKLTDIAEEDQNTTVAKHVEYIMSCLQKEYKQNGKKPISYYHFVIDPTSFSNSVENIFYVSFLIKDGFVSLSEDGEHGLPVLKVIGRSHREGASQTSGQKKQLIITINQDMWREIVDGLGLTTPAIDPSSRNSHAKRPRHDRQQE